MSDEPQSCPEHGPMRHRSRRDPARFDPGAGTMEWTLWTWWECAGFDGEGCGYLEGLTAERWGEAVLPRIPVPSPQFVFWQGAIR